VMIMGFKFTTRGIILNTFFIALII
jgi:hypothetical protein